MTVLSPITQYLPIRMACSSPRMMAPLMMMLCAVSYEKDYHDDTIDENAEVNRLLRASKLLSVTATQKLLTRLVDLVVLALCT